MASAESVGETNTYKLIKIEGGGAMGFPIEIMNNSAVLHVDWKAHAMKQGRRLDGASPLQFYTERLRGAQ